MQLVKTIDSLREQLKPLALQGKKIGLVPTMGALHNGHGALIKASVDECDVTVVSVFLNPIQFGKNEDLNKYPARLEADVKLAPLPGGRIMSQTYGELPRYVEFGGLVFQPLHRNVIQAHGLPSRDFMMELDDFTHGGTFREKDDIVVLTTVLPHEVNARFRDYGRRIVTRVNGTEVKGLSHLYELLYPAEGAERPAYTVIELADAARPLILDNAVIDAANAQIKAAYNLPAEARLNP